MRSPPILALAKASVARIANATCLFSCGSSRSENGTYLPPFDPPPVPTIDKGLQYDRYSEAVRGLRPLFPLTCTFLEPDDVKLVGDIPIGAGGSADIWEGTIDGGSVFQKSCRCYESCDVEQILQVIKVPLNAPLGLHAFFFSDTSERSGYVPNSPTRTSSSLLADRRAHV